MGASTKPADPIEGHRISTRAARAPATTTRTVGLVHSVYRDFNAVRCFEDEWDAFAARAGDMFCTLTWYETWWRHFGDRRRLEVHVFREGDELVALLPIVRYTLRVAGIPLRMVQLVGCDHALAAAGLAIKRACIEPVMRALTASLTRTGPWDLLHLGPMRSYALEVPRIGHACAAVSDVDAVIIGNRDGCQTIYPLPETYERYIAGMSGSERRNIGRCERRLADSHTVELSFPHTLDEVEAALDHLVELHQELWKTKGRLGQFEEWPAFEPFYRDMCRVQQEAGRLVLVQLNVDGRPVGVEGGYAFGPRVHAIIRGYDPGEEWNKYSFGRILHCGMAREAIRRGAKLLDDGGGAFEYKHRLGGKLACARSVTVLHKGRAARVRFWLAARVACFLFGFGRRMWIYKLHRLGFSERPIRRKRLRAGFLAELYRRADFRLVGQNGALETRCVNGLRRISRPRWCTKPESVVEPTHQTMKGRS